MKTPKRIYKPNLKRQARKEFCGHNYAREHGNDKPTAGEIFNAREFDRAYKAWLERRGYAPGRLGKVV